MNVIFTVRITFIPDFTEGRINMNKIDEPISYRWPYSWEGMPGKPVVNRLLAAIIEGDILKMKYLFSQGADIFSSEGDTRHRVLFEIANNYEIMKCLVDNGMTLLYRDKNHRKMPTASGWSVTEGECLDWRGRTWGLMGSAYWYGAYDVLELLAANGYDDYGTTRSFYFLDDGEFETLDYDMMCRRDYRGLQIQMEHGYRFYKYPGSADRYRWYVLEEPQVIRKSIGLDYHARFGTVYDPGSEENHLEGHYWWCRYEDVPLIFGRKEAIERNKRREEDYYDRLRAQRDFLSAMKKQK